MDTSNPAGELGRGVAPTTGRLLTTPSQTTGSSSLWSTSTPGDSGRHSNDWEAFVIDDSISDNGELLLMVYFISRGLEGLPVRTRGLFT